MAAEKRQPLKQMAVLNYQVFGPAGSCLMEAPESCRYPRKIELSLLEAGYTIRLNGKRITKADIRKEVKENERRNQSQCAFC
jgi:hypothetical protein